MTKLTVQDIREQALYTAKDAACFLRLPSSTARAWAFGQPTAPMPGRRRFEPLIHPADGRRLKLSFINLVELSVLATIRRVHDVPMPQVRKAMRFLRERMPTRHPLADHEFQTDGLDLFVEKFGQLLNLNRQGQLEIKDAVKAYLKSVERDSKGIPIKLPLPLRDPRTGKPSQVVIDPERGFGRPVLDGVGVRTEIVVQRFRAGEGIPSIARDYAISDEAVEDVIRLAA